MGRFARSMTHLGRLSRFTSLLKHRNPGRTVMVRTG
jgi:hypothetical protein